MMEQVMTMVHRHENEWMQMHRRDDLSPADLDPERAWDKDGAVYECPCGVQFIMGPTSPDAAFKTVPRG